jgi:hypothetical protein
MDKIIFLLLLLFPTLSFGQNYTGNYRAIFFNLFSEPKTIIAEFEVKSDNAIIGKVKVGDEIKVFNGTVDKKGKFEAVSQIEGNTVYKLKGKFDKDNKVSFIQRVQVGSGMNKSVSENGFEGTFAKVATPVAETPQTVANKNFPVIDNGKNQLNIQHSTLAFGNLWTDFTAKITFGSSEKNTIGTTDKPDYFNLLIESKIEGQQKINLNTMIYLPRQKVWESKNIRTITYREIDKEKSIRNSFISASDYYIGNPQHAGGTLEIVKETDTQIVFKIANLKIKRVAKDDFVELNGFIYADKTK